MDNINYIQNSNIASNVKLFRNIRIVNSIVSDRCCIGDDCDVVNSELCEKSELGRRNLIRDSVLGRGTYTGTNSIIKNTTIGKYCSISWNVSIGGGNHDYHHVSTYTDYWYKRTFDIDVTSNTQESSRTHIGNDVWIGSGVTIINGVKIGDGCVIGAGAVITKDIPSYSIVVGVPGKVLKERFEPQIISALLKIKWWDWPEEKIINHIDFLRKSPSMKELNQILSDMHIDKNNE